MTATSYDGYCIPINVELSSITKVFVDLVIIPSYPKLAGKFVIHSEHSIQRRNDGVIERSVYKTQTM